MKKLIMIFWLCLPLFVNAQTLHLILIADTDDNIIGRATQKARNNLKNFALTLKNQMNMSNTSITENVDLDVCYQLTTKSDDVIVFYYNGHGFNSGGNDRFPVLIQGKSHRQWIVPLRDIFNRFKYKPHKLLLVIAETSNTIRNITLTAQTTIDNRGGSVYGENYLISSSRCGQDSYIYGGMFLFTHIFTHFFVEYLEYSTSISLPDILNNIVSKTEQKARENGFEQTPQWSRE